MTLDEKDLLTIFTYASSQLIVMERVRKKARLKGIKDITKQKPLGRRVKIVEDGFLFWIVAIGLAVTVLHNVHLHTLFENDRYFSHLSSLERELSFRTEMGLYYSYFKTIVMAPSLLDGIEQIMADNQTEYPSTINTLQRFNLYPEVVLGGLFRLWKAFLTLQGSSGVNCFQVSRGLNQPPVTACDGLGDPAYFYIYCVFLLNGLMAGVIFVLGSYLSDCILGGVMSTVLFFFNHGEATRVMWTPPLRESFAMPFLILQLLTVTHCIRHRSPGPYHYSALVAVTLAFLLPWQFSQFVLVTQVFSLLMLHSLRLLPSHQLSCIYISLAASFLANLVLQYFNRLLLTSVLPASIFSCLIVLSFQRLYDNIPWTTLRICAEVLSALLLTICSKVTLSLLMGGTDDAHVVAIFLSKITSYHDFHTQLYTCSPEFDLLPLDYLVQVTSTFLLPAAGLVILLITHAIWCHLHHQHTLASLPEQTYHLFQCLAFALLAILIMRLKLFLTPHLCLMATFLTRYKFQSVLSPRVMVGVLLVGGSFKGLHNLWHQWSIEGEFNDPQLEELVRWADSASVPSRAVFAGAMPTMAALRLSTSRPVVNHPHYEDATLRNKTKEIYSIYSRKSPAEIHDKLARLQVTHVVVEEPWCKKRYRPGCSFAEVWDELDPDNQERPQFCQLILDSVPEQFQLVFSNSVYRVLHLQ